MQVKDLPFRPNLIPRQSDGIGHETKPRNKIQDPSAMKRKSPHTRIIVLLTTARPPKATPDDIPMLRLKTSDNDAADSTGPSLGPRSEPSGGTYPLALARQARSLSSSLPSRATREHDQTFNIKFSETG